MAAGTFVIVAALLAMAAAQHFWQAVTAMTLLAMGTSLNYGLANTTVQERAPGPMRGRVSALAMLSFVGVMPFATLGITRIADSINIRHTVAGCAIGYGIAALYLFAGPARRANELPVEAVAAVSAEA